MSKKGNPYNLTDKQAKFCKEFIIDFNGKQAAIRAGYSEKTASMFMLKESKVYKNIVNIIYECTINDLAKMNKLSTIIKRNIIDGVYNDENDYRKLYEHLENKINNLENSIIINAEIEK